jgi:L-ascorbate metabolism protein UlaG (beta-lactamase superfamily)
LIGVGGGAFLQDVTVAKAAIKKYFNPKTIIPMHYGEVPFNLATEIEVKNAFKDDKRAIILKPGVVKSF